jgi:hypothetical protein
LFQFRRNLQTSICFHNSVTNGRILLLPQGLKRTEQQPLLDRFNNRSSEGLPAPIAVQPSGQLVLAPLSTQPQSPVAFGQPSREAMMARAAALGRGAMAQSAAAAAAASSTGLKRLFALAEQAKEGAAKKEGTFRKLFNT